MTTASPIQQNDRVVIVDIIRGFTLIGVLIANFTGYNSENLPSSVFDSISSPLDIALKNFNTVFFEWKFYSTFSILFGYGFGLILNSLEKKNINPDFFFMRRMFWLFVMGVIHTLFWWGDVLHLYAVSGVFLLAFRKLSTPTILICSLLCMFIIPPFISFLFRNEHSYFTDENLKLLYSQYVNGNIIDVFKANINLYYKAWILNPVNGDLREIIDVTGRFLFGYFLVRIRLFESIENKKSLFKNILFITAPLMIAYFIIRWLSLQDVVKTHQIFWEPLMKLGILSTACFYASLLVVLFIRFGRTTFFAALQSLGKMNLTNYLLVSAISVILLYGIGFGQLGMMPMHTVWICAFLWLIVEILFSTFWLNRFRFGPVEWIWRQLAYNKRIQLKK
jgi:uncharacterized protein